MTKIKDDMYKIANIIIKTKLIKTKYSSNVKFSIYFPYIFN